MARPKTLAQNDDRIALSVLESPGVTENRTRQEHRVGSGNVRSGQAHAMRQAGAISSSKTGRDRPRGARNRKHATKRPSRH